jgi:hypothetical protein
MNESIQLLMNSLFEQRGFIPSTSLLAAKKPSDPIFGWDLMALCA